MQSISDRVNKNFLYAESAAAKPDMAGSGQSKKLLAKHDGYATGCQGSEGTVAGNWFLHKSVGLHDACGRQYSHPKLLQFG